MTFFETSSSSSLSLREKCPYFSFSGTYFPAFVLNMDQKNSEYGHFSHSVQYLALHPIGLLSDCSARVALSPKVMATPEICVQVLCLYINY